MASFDPHSEAGWPSPTTPEQQYLAAKIRCGDLDGARSFVGILTAESRQKITEDSNLMLAALRENKPEFIRLLVEECNAGLETPVWDPETFQTYLTPLRYAVTCRMTEAAIELMRLGANVNAVSPITMLTALHDACENGSLVIVRHLIQHGADLTARSYYRRTALMCGIRHVDVLRELLDSGADVNATDEEGDTALHDVVDSSHRNPEVVKLLLEYGTDLFIKNQFGEDAHFIACREKATDIVKVMRDQFSGDEVGHKALIRSHQLLGACYIDYSNPLGRFSRVDQALVEWETAVRVREERRHVISGEDDVVSTPNSAYDNAVEVDSMVKFDEMRQDMNKICMQGLLLKEKTLGPTHYETIKCVKNMTEYYMRSEDYGRGLRLLRHGFNLSRYHKVESTRRRLYFEHLWRNSVRHIGEFNKQAINNTAVFKDVYDFLEAITEEAKRSVVPTTGDSSLTLSFMDGAESAICMQVILFLIKLFFLLDANEVHIIPFRMLVHDFVRLNLRSSWDRTILMKAICLQDCGWFSFDVDAIKLLLECGADTWETDSNGNSVLHLLAKSEQWMLQATGNVPSKEASKKVAEILLAFGAHFDARNNEGFTAVDYLSSMGLQFSAHMTLQCLAAQAIRRHKIPYAGILPKSLIHFVEMH